MHSKNDKRLHYYLVAGNVVVLADDGESPVSLPANAMLTSDRKLIGQHELGKAQQALQIQVSKKMGEVPKVLDVLLIAFTYLGYMTQAEFTQRPTGLELVEQAAPTAEVIDITEELNARS